MSRYWIGVASRDHVLKGVEGGFCQYCHGMAWPIRKLSNGDGIVYYSPRTERRGGDPVQGFTAIGEVTDNTPRQVEMAPGFVPMRCTVEFVSCQETPIRQLLDHLDFSRGNPNWGYLMRRGFFEISQADFEMIAQAMKAVWQTGQSGADRSSAA